MSVTGTPGAVAGQPSVVIPADEFRSLLRTMEQICANQARATDRLPRHLTPEVSVQPYSGVDKQQTVFEFLGSLKDLKNSKEIPDAVFLEKWVPVYLKGVARSWFDHHFVGVVWDDFEAAIKSRFGSSLVDEQLRDKIDARKMHFNEDVEDYIDDLCTLNSKLSEPISDKELIRKILSGMTASLRAMVRHTWDFEIAELKVLAIRIQGDMRSAVLEKQLFEKSKNHPPQFNHSNNTSAQGGSNPAGNSNKVSSSTNRKASDLCFRCGNPGHRASVCEAPKPAPRPWGADQQNYPNSEN